jgi:hypothetical protein
MMGSVVRLERRVPCLGVISPDPPAISRVGTIRVDARGVVSLDTGEKSLRGEAAGTVRIVRDDRDAWVTRPGELQVAESGERDLVLQTEVPQG